VYVCGKIAQFESLAAHCRQQFPAYDINGETSEPPLSSLKVDEKTQGVLRKQLVACYEVCWVLGWSCFADFHTDTHYCIYVTFIRSSMAHVLWHFFRFPQALERAEIEHHQRRRLVQELLERTTADAAPAYLPE
jgi:hypothetical protein